MDLVEEGWTWPDPEKYRYVKRTPQRPFSEGSVLYISRQSKQKAVIKRVNELLREKGGCAIAGLGAAVRTAVRIALAVRRLYASDAGLQVWPTTTTVKLVDDFEPLVDVRGRQRGWRG